MQQSAVLLRQNIGTFHQRSPMFSFSEAVAGTKKYHTDCEGTLSPPKKRRNKTSQKEGRKRLRGKRKDKDSFTYGIQIDNDAKRKRLFFVKMPDFLSQNNVSTIHLFAKITKFASSSTWIQAHIRNPPHL
ncbi:MAG: hypothetical protein MR517_09400 [Bacteroidales bacterium]|nr:hypothetical protein [Bacteroidales bacterium]